MTDIQPIVHLPHITQISDSHCGPAVVQLLFAHLHRTFSQDQIVAAAGVANTIKDLGTTPKDLALAVRRLAPDLQLWFKQNTNWIDLEFLIRKYHWPVAVNWQGLFYDTEEEEQRENPNGDHGHYSVITNVDLKAQVLTIYDPYSEYSVRPRIFRQPWFERRWWDTNDDLITRRLVYIMTSVQAKFPEMLGMTTQAPPSSI